MAASGVFQLFIKILFFYDCKHIFVGLGLICIQCWIGWRFLLSSIDGRRDNGLAEGKKSMLLKSQKMRCAIFLFTNALWNWHTCLNSSQSKCMRGNKIESGRGYAVGVPVQICLSWLGKNCFILINCGWGPVFAKFSNYLWYFIPSYK